MARAAVVLFITSSAGAALPVAGPFSVADVLMLGSLIAAVLAARNDGPPRPPAWVVVWAVYVLLAALAATMAALSPEPWFSQGAAGSLLARYAALLIAFVLVGPLLLRNADLATRTLARTVQFVATIGVTAWCLAVATGDHATLGGTVLWTSALVPRAQSLFAEPAHFGVFVALGLPLLLQGHIRVRRLVLPLAAIALSLSPSAIGVAGVLMAATLFTRTSHRIDARARRWVLAVAVAGLLTAVALPPESVAHDATVGRVEELLAGREASGRARLVGSWTPTLISIRERPVLGSGPGNLGRLALDIDPSVRFLGVDEERHTWNAFAMVLGTTGLAGLVALVGLVVAIADRSRLAALSFVAYAFSSSTLAIPLPWVFVFVTSALRRHKGERR